MIGLDTNILVRYIVRDEPAQTAAATRLIETHCSDASPGFVSQLVLAELFWVLNRAYQYDKPLLLKLFSTLLSAAELQVEQAQDAWQALWAYESGSADFADYLIARRSCHAGCSTTYTFDRKAARSALHTLLES